MHATMPFMPGSLGVLAKFSVDLRAAMVERAWQKSRILG